MRNRSNTPPKDESAFINGGSAGLNTEENKPEIKKTVVSKAKPVSISLADENLRAIDNIIKNEMVEGGVRVNRSDVVRAAVMGLEKLTKAEISKLIEKAKLK
ncbi:hypothetical protein [Atlantibacter hermannii]|uniref:hypothetical protein n=1 Tax=Atlantibacter hermannii TaxID=565 RepID=UPI00289A72AD|nr:hypothetical protein [Atlantibacter hermannii]